MPSRPRLVWRRRAGPQLVWLLAVGEVPVLVLAGTLLVALWPDRSPHPERATARIATCGIQRSGAEISYTVTNLDRAKHGYRVELTVTTATSVLGSGTSLLPGVPAGATVAGRALVPVSGDLSGATCKARAVVFDGAVGHRE